MYCDVPKMQKIPGMGLKTSKKQDIHVTQCNFMKIC
jgi:hypothetical protein